MSLRNHLFQLVSPARRQRVDVVYSAKSLTIKENLRQLVCDAKLDEARQLAADEAQIVFELGSEFLTANDTRRGLYCRRLASELAPERADWKWPLPFLEIEDTVGQDHSKQHASIWSAFDKWKSIDTVPRTLIDRRFLGAHIEVLNCIDRTNRRSERWSATTERFRYEVLYYLLDNPPAGPMIEIGTQYGGTTCLLSYIAALTNRKFVAIDLNANWLDFTRETCRRFGLDRGVTFFPGTLADFLRQEKDGARMDLVFLDSSHDYNATLGELRLLHDLPQIPRSITLHDFNYRCISQLDLFGGDLAATNPNAVDHATYDFLKAYLGSGGRKPILKRIGAFAGDGTTTVRTAPGAGGDYVDDYGTEGMMLLYA
jgi:Methyltransferase domain